MKSRVIIAVGGSGGHLFPAQALVGEWKAQNPKLNCLFVGSGLESNPYFSKDKYPYRSISSATPFRSKLGQIARSLVSLSRGIKDAFRIIREFSPDLVVGFGSFHSFPILFAACFKRVPLVLFESNAIPGKVTRIFAPFAHLTALHLPQAKLFLKGKTVDVRMPIRPFSPTLTTSQARQYFGLSPDLPTLLVFGGSQGAQAINQKFLTTVEKVTTPFQVIHLVGQSQSQTDVEHFYQQKGISACVKHLETQMDCAYRAATLVISRAGAVTLAELIAFAVPAILIPYPHAAENHQLKNAQFFQNVVKGAICLEEKDLSVDTLYHTLLPFIQRESEKREEMKNALEHFKSQENKDDLCQLLQNLLMR